MEIRSDLSVDDRALTAFCRRHGIRRLALFGSVLEAEAGQTAAERGTIEPG